MDSLLDKYVPQEWNAVVLERIVDVRRILDLSWLNGPKRDWREM